MSNETQTFIPGTVDLARPGRPKQTDKALLYEAMRKLYDKHLYNDIPYRSDDDYTDIINKLVENYSYDAYTFARNLEDEMCIDMDYELCTKLDSAWGLVRRELEAATTEWIRKYPFELYTIGTYVQFMGHKPCEGFIVDVKSDTAEYVINTDPNQKTGRIVQHEQTKPTT